VREKVAERFCCCGRREVLNGYVKGLLLLEVVGALVGEEVLFAVGVRDTTIIGVGEIEGVGVLLSL